CRGDRLGHRALALARLEALDRPRERSLVAEDRADVADERSRRLVLLRHRVAYNGNRFASASTSFRTACATSWSSGAARTRAMNPAMASISASPSPRVVTAGVPMRIPLAVIGGFLSNGIAFLLTVMPARPSAASATLPVIPFENTSTSIR